jgi:hypothetical protein
MPATTSPPKFSPIKKVAIDPELLDGIPARAYELLGPNPTLEHRTEDLYKAAATFEAGLRHANGVIARTDELALQITECQDDTAREKLRTERRSCTGELAHVAPDVAATAQPFAETLLSWAHCALPLAKARIVHLDKQIAPLERERMRRRSLIDCDVPVAKKKSAHEEKEIQHSIDALWAKIDPLKQQREAARRVYSEVGGLLESRFGRGYQGTPNAAGVHRWVAGVRERIARRTIERRGLSDALKPRGLG